MLPLAIAPFLDHDPAMSDPSDTPPDRGLELTERFFREARKVLLAPSEPFLVSAADFLAIAQQPSMRSEFERRFCSEINDPGLKRLILRFLEEAATRFEESAERGGDNVETIDKAGLGVAGSATVAAIGAIVATGGAAAPVIFLAASLVGIASLGIARHVIRRRARESKYSAQRPRSLLRHLESDNGSG